MRRRRFMKVAEAASKNILISKERSKKECTKRGTALSQGKKNMTNTEQLFEGDKRCEVIIEHIIDLLYEEARGMPIPTILGILDLTHRRIIQEAEEEL